MGLITQNAPEGDSTAQTWLSRAKTSVPASFLGTEFVGAFAVQTWETDSGNLALIHPLTATSGTTTAYRALRQHHGENLAGQYACLVIPQIRTQVIHPYTPSLLARDTTGHTDEYETSWQQLALVLGQPAPYWFHQLRDRDALSGWHPGAPPALVPAADIATPVAALTELAADEPTGSPAAAVCWHLARDVRRRGHRGVSHNIDELRKEASAGGDAAYLVLGAVPAPLHRPDPEEPSEMVRRAGWLTITERRDVLAHRVADFAQSWDAGADWHTGAVTELDPDTCSTAREWAARLTHAPGDQPPTVLEKLLLDNGNDPERDVLLHDPVAGTPVLHREPGTRRAGMLSFNLQRLLTRSRLATLTLSKGIAWVRTDDGTLWLAPERDDYGIGYGYSGTGCFTLARLIDALLDDITAPAVAPDSRGEPPRGLFALLSNSDDTTYTRAQLIAARTRTV
ncbi:hypothetical protein AB0M66_23260 [Streptomyces albidoflavus]|uniref:hypothetical protein n=1 Tax=Streptomyces albidoflavus TaxID=1886 RepID=UPI0034301AAA